MKDQKFVESSKSEVKKIMNSLADVSEKFSDLEDMIRDYPCRKFHREHPHCLPHSMECVQGYITGMDRASEKLLAFKCPDQGNCDCEKRAQEKREFERREQEQRSQIDPRITNLRHQSDILILEYLTDCMRCPKADEIAEGAGIPRAEVKASLDRLEDLELVTRYGINNDEFARSINFWYRYRGHRQNTGHPANPLFRNEDIPCIRHWNYLYDWYKFKPLKSAGDPPPEVPLLLKLPSGDVQEHMGFRSMVIALIDWVDQNAKISKIEPTIELQIEEGIFACRSRDLLKTEDNTYYAKNMDLHFDMNNSIGVMIATIEDLIIRTCNGTGEFYMKSWQRDREFLNTEEKRA